MSLSPIATTILSHLRASPSLRIVDMRRITRLDTAAVKAAALELCRAGLATSEWQGMRFRARVPARAME